MSRDEKPRHRPLRAKLLTNAGEVVTVFASSALAASSMAQSPSHASTAIAVNVEVLAYARLSKLDQPKTFNVTSADLARGYVDLPGSLRFSVSTNSRAGYSIDLQAIGDQFGTVLVAGLDEVVQVDLQGVSITQRGATNQEMRHVLGFRVTFKPGTRAGLYVWPLVLVVRPLG